MSAGVLGRGDRFKLQNQFIITVIEAESFPADGEPAAAFQGLEKDGLLLHGFGAGHHRSGQGAKLYLLAVQFVSSHKTVAAGKTMNSVSVTFQGHVQNFVTCTGCSWLSLDLQESPMGGGQGGAGLGCCSGRGGQQAVGDKKCCEDEDEGREFSGADHGDIHWWRVGKSLSAIVSGLCSSVNDDDWTSGG